MIHVHLVRPAHTLPDRFTSQRPLLRDIIPNTVNPMKPRAATGAWAIPEVRLGVLEILDIKQKAELLLLSKEGFEERPRLCIIASPSRTMNAQ